MDNRTIEQIRENEDVLIKLIEAREQEIERLRAELKLEEDNRKYLNEQIERLHSIIKEAREYITKQVHRNQQFYEMDIDNILEILDKVEEK